ncbi:MAG TPA: hypothetical protein VK249_13570 [Anaerolineales bacterium]|nr:hypothetical protein [Anaerolineales bacterium]
MQPNTACRGLAGTVQLFGQILTRQPLTPAVGLHSVNYQERNMSNLQNESDSEQIYNPPVWLLFLAVYVVSVAGVFLGWFSSYLPEILNGRLDKWLDNSSFFLSFAFGAAIWTFLLIGLNRDWYAIKIDKVSISGQANLGGRKVILRSELDKEKTRLRTTTEKLFRVWNVWDKNGNKIAIQGLFFPSEQIADIFKAIGCE